MSAEERSMILVQRYARRWLARRTLLKRQREAAALAAEDAGGYSPALEPSLPFRGAVRQSRWAKPLGGAACGSAAECRTLRPPPSD